MRVFVTGQREGAELQRGGPPLGAVGEELDLLGVEPELGKRGEEGGDLVDPEGEVALAHLADRAAGAPPGQGEWRVDPARHDELEGVGEVLDQLFEPEIDGFVVDDV